MAPAMSYPQARLRALVPPSRLWITPACRDHRAGRGDYAPKTVAPGRRAPRQRRPLASERRDSARPRRLRSNHRATSSNPVPFSVPYRQKCNIYRGLSGVQLPPPPPAFAERREAKAATPEPPSPARRRALPSATAWHACFFGSSPTTGAIGFLVRRITLSHAVYSFGSF